MLAADGRIQDEPEPWLVLWRVADMVGHVAAGVQVELKGGAEVAGQVLAGVQDELQSPYRACKRFV